MMRISELDQFLSLNQDGGSPLLYPEGMRKAFKYSIEKVLKTAGAESYGSGECSMIRIQLKCVPRQPRDKVWAGAVLGDLCGKTLELEISKIRAGKGFSDIDWGALHRGASTARFRE